MRETLQTPGATAALITPTAGLAGRVAIELLRWGIVAEDSAGLSLAVSPAGRLARLAAELAADLARDQADAIPARLIALLSHPMVHLGLPRPDVVRGAAALEIGLLRGLVPAPGFDGLRKALAAERARPPRAPALGQAPPEGRRLGARRGTCWTGWIWCSGIFRARTGRGIAISSPRPRATGKRATG
ncbi:hypothetical protein ACU4GA_14530 [Methylobacterium oryzae CBMB20]